MTFSSNEITSIGYEISAVKRDPHNQKLLGAAIDEQISIFDVRREIKAINILAHSD